MVDVDVCAALDEYVGDGDGLDEEAAVDEGGEGGEGGAAEVVADGGGGAVGQQQVEALNGAVERVLGAA